MRAVVYRRYGPPDVLETVDADDPVPRAGEVKVRVRAASLNPLDAKLRAGHLRLLPTVDRPPRGTGVDFAGDVVATGGNTPGVFPGMRVFGSLSPFRRAGSCAEYLCVRSERLAPVPDALTDAVAAALPIAAGTAVQALADHATLAPGMRVLVIGAAGGVGHFAVQYAKHVGAHVTATCGADNVAFVASLGADAVIDYARDDATRDAATFDVVFDVAGRSSFGAMRRHLAPEGVYLNTCGDAGAVAQTIGSSVAARITGRQRVVALAIRGGSGAWRRLAGLAVERALVPHVRATIGLVQVADAHRELDAGHGRGKFVVEPSS